MLVILKWSKNHKENQYLKIDILWVALAVASEVATAAAAASLNDLKIELWMFDISVGIALGYLTVQQNRKYFPEK